MVQASTHTVAAVVFAVAATVLSGSLSCGFTFDDGYAILDNKDVPADTPLSTVFENDFWGVPMASPDSHLSYRPLTVLSFRADRIMGQWLQDASWFNMTRPGPGADTVLEPRVFHGSQISLYALACAGFVYAIDALCARQLSGAQLYVAGLLFAVHPVHTDAACSCVGRAEILCALCFFAAIVCYTAVSWNAAARWGGCLACTVCAVLCKEHGITVLGVLGAHEVLQRCRGERTWKQVAAHGCGLLLATAAIVYVRVVCVQGGALATFDGSKNPASRANGFARVATKLLYATQVGNPPPEKASYAL